MKRVSYKEFKENVKKSASITRDFIDRRAPRRRPRDPGETEALILLANKAWENSIACGKLQKKGERLYALKINWNE
ncbi:MAG TPA: hypothetical protein DEF34_07255 [Desulfotomaculum sp.]|nr:MAG: hypothetical protein VR67_00315 [Peptococcaceae bacterium BRH_c8a]KJS77163.1 MAG: hypothetical protein JL56_03875 [Desulfotomaculum sp. BICA1-6]HBX23408.1 hypothetical protein [Desulfotomaculum sp.]